MTQTTVELQAAFFFYCEHCAAKNYGDLLLVEPMVSGRDDGRIGYMVPQKVQCRECGNEFCCEVSLLGVSMP